MNVLIAGRTKMGGNARCIGGLLDDGTPVRLLKGVGQHWDTSAPFDVGENWEISYAAGTARPEPHTEDVVVTKRKYIDDQPNLRARLVELSEPWEGGINQLFDGMLGFTGSDNGYISERLGVPDNSTGFWIPDRELQLRDDGKHYDYVRGFFRRGLSYVGEQEPVKSIPAGTLVRVSLAGWWKPDDVDMEERCYLQLSGWF